MFLGFRIQGLDSGFRVKGSVCVPAVVFVDVVFVKVLLADVVALASKTLAGVASVALATVSAVSVRLSAAVAVGVASSPVVLDVMVPVLVEFSSCSLVVLDAVTTVSVLLLVSKEDVFVSLPAGLRVWFRFEGLGFRV